MLRIAHVVPTFHPAYYYGGPIETTLQLCRHVAEAGCEVRVLTTNANGPRTALDVPPDREVPLGPRLTVRYSTRAAMGTVSPSLLRVLPSYVGWADVVQLTAVYNFPTLPTLLACRARGKGLVWSPHGALQQWEGGRRPLLKAAWNLACRAVGPRDFRLHVTSDDEARESLQRFPGRRVAVVPNGVSLPEDLRPVPPSGVLRLAFIGRIDPKKGIENLLEACALLSRRGSVDWSLAIAGSGDAEYEARIDARIAQVGIGDRARRVGTVRDDARQRFFESADVVVVPSHTENFGMVVVEALAHAVPVIASTGTPWSALETHACGLHVENSPESLAAAIERVSAMPLREMGLRGRAWVERDFDWRSVAARMVELYRDVARG